jgi:hypothetical protein
MVIIAANETTRAIMDTATQIPANNLLRPVEFLIALFSFQTKLIESKATQHKEMKPMVLAAIGSARRVA